MEYVKEALTFMTIIVAATSPLIAAGYWAIRQAIKRGSFMENINHLIEKFNELVEEVGSIKDMITDIREENRQRHRESEKQIGELDVRVSKVEVILFDSSKNISNIRN